MNRMKNGDKKSCPEAAFVTQQQQNQALFFSGTVRTGASPAT